MTELETSILRNLSKEVTPLLNTEDLVLEAVHSLVQDEIKEYIRKKLNEDEVLRKELRDTVELYMEAKLKELYYAMKIAKTGTKLGLNLIPEKLREEISNELSRVVEKEMSTILEKSFD